MFVRNFLNYFFSKWWRPSLFLVFTVGLIYVSGLTHSIIFQYTSLAFFCIAVLCLLISAVVGILKKRWSQAIFSFAFFCLTIIAFIYIVIALFLDAQSTPDTFADHLQIPADIPVEIPINLTFDEGRPDSIAKTSKLKTDFQLYNSFQPGLYEYDFWTGHIEKGSIYLKAYEITHNYPLSTDRLPGTSVVSVYNPDSTIQRFSTKNDFTIYEGDWGKPYAARFEVWFRPLGKGEERKLFQKNYKIEGWMR